MNGQQFFKEIMDIPGVIQVAVTNHDPRYPVSWDPHKLPPAYTEVIFSGVGPYGEEINVCVKHGAAIFAYEAAVNLATQFCTQPVL